MADEPPASDPLGEPPPGSPETQPAAAAPERAQPTEWNVRRRPAPAHVLPAPLPGSPPSGAFVEPPAGTPRLPPGSPPYGAPPATPHGPPEELPPGFASPTPSGQPAPPSSAFPTTTQLVAIIAVLVLIVAGAGVYLLRSGPTAPVASTAPPPLGGGAVAVVHNGPALLSSQPLSGGNAKHLLTLTGSPNNMVTTPDGSKAFLLDSNHGQIIPVDLVTNTVGTPIHAGKLPIDEHISRDGATLYVTDNGGNAVIPIDTATSTPQPPVALPQGVDAFIPAPSGNSFLVGLYGSAGQPGIIVFSNRSAQNLTAINVGLNSPIDGFFSPDGATVWILEQGVGSNPGVVIPVTVATHAVGAPILVGHAPGNAALSTDGHTLVVSNSLDSTATIIDLAKGTAIATVNVGADPGAVHFTSDGATAWIACVLDKTLVPIDMRTNTAGPPVALTNAPTDLSVAPTGGTAWVLYPSSAGSVNFLSGPAYSASHAIPVGNGPNLMIAHDSRTAWVTNSLSDTVQHIDMAGNRAGPAIHVARTPGDLVLSSDDRTVYVTSFGDGVHSGFLTAIDTGTSKAATPLDIGPAPGSLTLSPDGATGYVDRHEANSITVIDIKHWKVGPTIALPCSPTDLVITPDGGTAYADCSESSQILPINAKTEIVGPAIAVGGNSRMVMGNHGKRLFVKAAHQIQVIDTAANTVILSHDESGNIVSIVPSPDDRTLLGVDNAGAALVLLDAQSLATTKSVSLGTRPDGIALSLDGSHAYVLDSSAQKMFVVDVAAAAVIATLDVAPNARSVVVPARLH